MLTSEQPWNPHIINEDLPGKITPQEEDSVMTATTNKVSGINTLVQADTAPPDYEKHIPHLGWASLDRVKQTFQHTTQLAVNVLRLPLRRHFKSRFPYLNRNRLAETFSTDTLFSSVTALGGETCAQVFVGKKSLLLLGLWHEKRE